MKIKKKNDLIMDYRTYAVLRSFVEKQMEVDHFEYVKALDHLDTLNNYTKAQHSMWETFMKKKAGWLDVLEKLKFAAMSSEGPGISKEMREFWGF